MRRIPADMHVITDITYAPANPAVSEGHLLDLYLPTTAHQPMPLVLWSHGSAWEEEIGRLGADRVAEQLAPYGFAVAGVNIRSSGYAHFPAQLHDIKAAIRWLWANAAGYGLDPERFAAIGESSGGWAAVMAALTIDLPEMEGDVGMVGLSSRVQAAIALYPPTDLLQMEADMPGGSDEFNRIAGVTAGHADPQSPESLLLGGPMLELATAARQASPVSYAHADAPPLLLIHGERDPLVPSSQSRLLYDALARVGADVTLVLLPLGGHGPWDAFLSDPGVSAGAVMHAAKDVRGDTERPAELSWDTLAAFLNHHLRREA